jgi:hypothetical protein
MSVTAAILLALALGTSPAVAPHLPELLLEAPEELEGLADELAALPPERFSAAMGLIGLAEPGGPITVVLAPEDSPEARAAEDWVAGYAYGALGRVVLLVDRTPRYPDGSLLELLDHEVAHVLIARAAGNREVPRWFNEGLSMVAGHAWGFGDRSRLSLAMITRSDLPLDALDAQFSGHRGEVGRAYALAGALVRDLLARFGPDAAARILRDVRLGATFDAAVRRSTGRSVQDLETSFWRRHSFTYRWVPLLTSSFTLWAGIVLLALVAFRRRRQRDAEIRAQWDLEEELEEQRRALEGEEPPPLEN